jgi:hypothetical protein
MVLFPVILLLAILVQVLAGVGTAIFYRWGSSYRGGIQFDFTAPLYPFSAFSLYSSPILLAIASSGGVESTQPFL